MCLCSEHHEKVSDQELEQHTPSPLLILISTSDFDVASDSVGCIVFYQHHRSSPCCPFKVSTLLPLPPPVLPSGSSSTSLVLLCLQPLPYVTVTSSDPPFTRCSPCLPTWLRTFLHDHIVSLFILMPLPSAYI